MSDLKTTLESFLAGKQEQSDMVRALQQTPSSAEHVVDLAYHLMLAGKALDEKEAVLQAHTYFTTRKNLHELVTLLESYAHDSRALATSLNKDELKRRIAELHTTHAGAKQQFAVLSITYTQFSDANTDRMYGQNRLGMSAAKSYKQFLKQQKLNDKEFVAKYTALLQQHDVQGKHIKALWAEIVLLTRALELYDKRPEFVKERQQRMASINEGLLTNLYAAMIQPASKPASQHGIAYQKIEEPKPVVPPTDIKDVVHEVVDLSKHALTKMAEVAKEGGAKVIKIDAGQSLPQQYAPALPAAKRLKASFSEPDARIVHELVLAHAGLSANAWLRKFKDNPAEAAKAFIEKYGEQMKSYEHEVFYE